MTIVISQCILSRQWGTLELFVKTPDKKIFNIIVFRAFINYNKTDLNR